MFPTVIPDPWVDSHALRTRAPLSPKASFDLHVLGMPPAFVLSQDQTLKFVSYTRPARRTANRQSISYKEPITCTVKRNGYEGQYSRRLNLTGTRGLEFPGPGAVAHMSFHRKPTMSKSHRTSKGGQRSDPRFTPGDRLTVYVGDRVLRGRWKPSAPRRWSPSRRGPGFGQRLFAKKLQQIDLP